MLSKATERHALATAVMAGIITFALLAFPGLALAKGSSAAKQTSGKLVAMFWSNSEDPVEGTPRVATQTVTLSLQTKGKVKKVKWFADDDGEVAVIKTNKRGTVAKIVPKKAGRVNVSAKYKGTVMTVSLNFIDPELYAELASRGQ